VIIFIADTLLVKSSGLLLISLEPQQQLTSAAYWTNFHPSNWPI